MTFIMFSLSSLMYVILSVCQKARMNKSSFVSSPINLWIFFFLNGFSTTVLKIQFYNLAALKVVAVFLGFLVQSRFWSKNFFPELIKPQKYERKINFVLCNNQLFMWVRWILQNIFYIYVSFANSFDFAITFLQIFAYLKIKFSLRFLKNPFKFHQNLNSHVK